MHLQRCGRLLANSARLKRASLSPGLSQVLRRGEATATRVAKPYYITTPIFYPNSDPHMGHLHSLVIADIFARYAKLVNPDRPVHLLTGTDEHGLKIQKAAQASGQEPRDFCDKKHSRFRRLAKIGNIDFTVFARTTDNKHKAAVQHLWKELEARGLLYKGTHEGWYSVTDECFYTDKQVERVTEGDEEKHVSTETGSLVEWTKEENYMFRLSAFQKPLLAHFESNPDAIFPAQYHADVVAILSKPLEDLSVSRPSSRLSWGIPVPNDHDHTIYVWIDALTVYLSSAGYPWATTSIGTSAGWPPDIQVIGKDILRFHAIYLPAMLQALEQPLPRQLLTHSHWTMYRKKMSKSTGNVADPFEVLKAYQSDVVRFYLAYVGGHFKDDVDWSDLQQKKHAKLLVAHLGNLLWRVATERIQQSVRDRSVRGIPAPMTVLQRENCHKDIRELLQRLYTVAHDYEKKMDALLLVDAMNEVLSTLAMANALLSQLKPWAPTTNRETVTQLYVAVMETLRVCAILFQPFTPSACKQILDELGAEEEKRSLRYAVLGRGAITKLGNIKTRVRVFKPLPKSTQQ